MNRYKRNSLINFSNNNNNHNNLFIIFIILLNFHLIITFCYGKECGTIDVRNRPSSLEQLRNCTVIKGHLQIVLIQGNDKTVYSDKDYENYTFPLLREITEFLIFFDVAGLTSLGKLFPNLTVIRGKKLFLNYALAIDSMPDLRAIDFKSLISIQRGSVYINRNPNLCYLEYINWDELTENKIGINFYRSMQPNDCLPARGCSVNYYWSYSYCQKFRTDNTVSSRNASDCHSQCLGGCRNSTNADCAVCKMITDGRYCVEKCPSDKYYAEDHLRCYTEQKCIEMGRYLFKNECVKECPSGYSALKTNKTEYHCKECPECTKICNIYDEIQYLSNAEQYKGCTIIKGNLSIRIMSKIDTSYLENALGDIVEIQDYLKIYRTPSITSLNFLKNLEIIKGESLELNHYALIIYENKNLKKLWNWETLKKNITIKNGGIFLYSNYKLCTNEIIKLHEYVKHNDSMNTIQENDEEVLCNPIRLNVHVTVESHESVVIVWSKDESADKTQLLYKKLKNSDMKIDDEYDDNVCYRDIWTKEILLHADLEQLSINNSSSSGYWMYKLKNLEQNTLYALVIKTYGNNSNKQTNVKNLFTSQSNVTQFKTKPDIPTSPQIYTLTKSPDSITLAWKTILENSKQLIEYYLIDVYVQPDDQNMLDTRDYCSDPLKQSSSSVLNGKIDDQNDFDLTDGITDYDNGNTGNGINRTSSMHLSYENCCNRIENDLEDHEFISLIDEKFRCSQTMNYQNSCRINTGSNPNGLLQNQFKSLDESSSKYRLNELIPDQNNKKYDSKSAYLIKSELISPTEKFFKIQNLTYYTLYIFQFFACNQIGCSAYELHSDRTAPLISADAISLQIRKGNKRNEYLLDFKEPEKPNGAIVAFTIEYRTVPDDSTDSNYMGAIKCITRLQHEENSYHYPIYISNKIFWARVKSVSLAGPGVPTDWIRFDMSSGDERVDGFVIFCIICLVFLIITLGWMIYRRFIYNRSFSILPNLRSSDEQILMQNFDTNYLDDSTEETDL